MNKLDIYSITGYVSQLPTVIVFAKTGNVCLLPTLDFEYWLLVTDKAILNRLPLSGIIMFYNCIIMYYFYTVFRYTFH